MLEKIEARIDLFIRAAEKNQVWGPFVLGVGALLGVSLLSAAVCVTIVLFPLTLIYTVGISIQREEPIFILGVIASVFGAPLWTFQIWPWLGL